MYVCIIYNIHTINTLLHYYVQLLISISII